MRFTVRVRGRGVAEVAAYGLADAEHLVEKELIRLLPGARVEVLEVRRKGEGEGGRIVEELAVTYLLEAPVEVESLSRESAPGEAFRLARGRLQGTRYSRASFEAAE